MTVPGEPGSLVILFLHSPKERVWGVLQRIDASGIWLEGINLDSFEDWARQVGRDRKPSIALSVVFYPMHRTEKVLLDRTGPGEPSLGDRFRSLVGMNVEEYLGLTERGDG